MFDMQVSSSSVPGTSEAPGTSSDIWRDWLSATSASQAIYLAQVSGALRFRVRAYDVAGNIGAWSSPQTTVVSGALVFLPLNR